MTDPLPHIRAAALALLETEERDDGFYVADTAFVRLVDGTAHALAASGWIALGDEDLDDRVAAAWELAAPRRLLEAGGR